MFEVNAMISPEGEKIPLNPKVLCENGVEKWLKYVEIKMQETLKKLLFGIYDTL